MRILVTNDDGILAPGLWKLVNALRDVGEVIVVAPDREQSAVGTSVTLHHPLRIKEVQPRIKGVTACAVEGTPSDSVILGLKLFAKDKVDLVVSGINEGVNLGNDVFISGTVAGALQGYFYEIPSIAISTALLGGKVRFEAAAKIGALLAKRVRDGVLHPRSLLCVNTPYLKPEQIEGVELTKLGRRTYHDEIQKGHDGKRDYYWIVRGEPVWDDIEGTDIWAIRNKRIAITPLPGNVLGSDRVKQLRTVCSSLSSELNSDSD